MENKKKHRIEFNEEVFKKVLSHYYGSIMITDGEGNILYINSNMAKLYKITLQQAQELSVYDLVEKGIIDSSACAESIAKKKMIISKLETASGIYVTCISNPIFDEYGNIQMVVIYGQDEALLREVIHEFEKTKEQKDTIKKTLNYLQDSDERNHDIIIADARMKELYKAVRNIAKTDSTIMLYGESGTGKEVLARYIHKNSNRKKEVFIPINCASIPNELMESEFFGYEKGSFTGANKDGKAGIFEMADKGTLFLDELGELPLSLQSKLLRVLESGEVKRVGGAVPFYTDVRILAATNRDLLKMVGEKSFREDLFYRINVLPIKIPPLRERPADIEQLVNFFIKKYNKKYGSDVYMHYEIMEKFENYDWPGNIRELRNEVERFVITQKENFDFVMGGYVMPGAKIKKNVIRSLEVFNGMGLKEAVDNYEYQYIKEVVKKCDGHIAEAAKLLGIHRSVLYRKIDKLEQSKVVK